MRFLLGFFFFFQLLTGCDNSPTTWPTNAFDKAAWNHAKEEDRFKYARNIVESKRLLDMSKKDLIDLLGPPSYQSPEDDYLTYVVKSDAGGVFILDIRLEDKGGTRRVRSAFIRIA